MNIKKLITLIFISLLTFCIFAQSNKTVKVAYYYSKNFQEGSSDEKIKNGYSYDYLQKISDETGWSFEYVYGNIYDLWLDFIEGKIDLMAGMGQYPDSTNLMLFPDYAMGKETYYIIKHENDNSISIQNLTELSKKKIGAISDNVMTSVLNLWLKELNLKTNIVLFDTAEKRDEAFRKGEVDCVVNTLETYNLDSKIYPLMKLYDNNYYLAVSKNRPDLLNELNRALFRINENTPFFIQSLAEKYYENTFLAQYLSDEEKQWINEHPVIKIGYLIDYLPFCDEKNGEVTGILKKVVDDVLKNLRLQDKLKVEYIAYSDTLELQAELIEGNIDLSFPIFKSRWHSEQSNFRETNAVCPAIVDIVFSGDYAEDKLSQIAISPHSPIQKIYTDLYYPDSEIIYYSNATECLKAVSSGKAKCTFLSSYRSTYLLNTEKFKKLKSLQLIKNSDYGFGVSNSNTQLLSIMNKGISQLNQEKIGFLLYEYTNNHKLNDIKGFILEHHKYFAIPSLIIILIMIFMFIAYFHIIHKSTKRLQEQLNIVESLSRDYENVYMLDLKTETFTIVKLEGYIPNNLFNKKDLYHPYMNTIIKYAHERISSEETDLFISHFQPETVISELSRQKEYRYNYKVITSNEVHHFQAKFTYAGTNSDRNKVIIAFANIDKMVQAAQEMENLKVQAETDGLTGVLNRGCGEASARKIISDGAKGIFLILDVDKFKQINDNFGHEIGDKVLIQVANCLKTSFRENDIIFRLGGDEFAVLAKDISSQNIAKKIINRFTKLIDKIQIPEMGDYKVTVSIGAKIFDEKEKDFTNLYKTTDAKVYTSKKINKTAVTFAK